MSIMLVENLMLSGSIVRKPLNIASTPSIISQPSSIMHCGSSISVRHIVVVTPVVRVLLVAHLVLEGNGRVACLLLGTQHLKGVNNNLGDILLGVVTGCVLTSPQLALNVEAHALADIFLYCLGLSAEYHQIVPLGTLWNLCAVLLGETFVGCCEG